MAVLIIGIFVAIFGWRLFKAGLYMIVEGISALMNK